MAKVTAFVALRVERPRVHGGDAWLPSDRTRAFAAVMTTCGLSCSLASQSIATEWSTTVR